MIFDFLRPESLRFRPMEPEDAARCAELHRGAFALPWGESDFEALLTDRAVVCDCMETAGRVLRAFALSRVALDEAELLTVVVDTSARGRGIGGAIIGHHVARLNKQGIKSVFLEVAEDNEPANRLYRRAGFIQIGRRNGYYGRRDGERVGAFTMKLELE